MPKRKYTHEAGYLGTGVVSRTFLAGLGSLDGILGPVFTPTKRATPRVVKALRYGFAADSMEQLRGCRRLFVCAPADETASLLWEAAKGKVLCDLDTLVLVESSAAATLDLSMIGCVQEVGCLSQLPNRNKPAYLVEGSLRFRRFCQLLLDVPLRRLVLAKPGARPMVEAGLFIAEEFCLPLLEAVQGTLALAGVAPDQAKELAAELLSESVENARFAGRKRWTGILHREDEERLAAIVGALQKENDLMANLVLGFTRHCLAMMGKDVRWIDGAESNGAPSRSGVAATKSPPELEPCPDRPEARSGHWKNH